MNNSSNTFGERGAPPMRENFANSVCTVNLETTQCEIGIVLPIEVRQYRLSIKCTYRESCVSHCWNEGRIIPKE